MGAEEAGGRPLPLQPGGELGERAVRDEAGAGVCVAPLPVVSPQAGPGDGAAPPLR